MSEVYGTNESLVIDDEVDSDGELNIVMITNYGDNRLADTWIDKDMAERIILKLGKVFDIV